MADFLASNDIQIYPSANRSVNQQSHLNTEYNLTHTKMLSKYLKNNRFSYSDETDSNYIIIYLDGYYFRTLKSKFTQLEDNKNIYVSALIKNYVPVEDSSLAQRLLVSMKDGESLALDNNNEFVGLKITNTQPDDIYSYVKITDNNGNIIEQNLKLSSTEVRNVDTDKSIYDEFNSQKIISDIIVTTNGKQYVNKNTGTVDTLNSTDKINESTHIVTGITIDDNGVIQYTTQQLPIYSATRDGFTNLK